jgi:hypothetical protein
MKWKGQTCLFFEDYDHRTRKGRISGVRFSSTGPQGDVFPVLEEPWHLSFPFVFEHEGDLWMIPESSQNRTVSIYRALDFPTCWVKQADLLTDIEASDSVVVSSRGLLWMFTTIPSSHGMHSDALCLFYSRSPLGPWSAHEANPVLVDRGAARSAGPMRVHDGVIWRPVQDCARRYGAAIGLAEITRLDQIGFEQRIHQVIRPGRHWPGWRLHTLSRAGSLECIDGAALKWRWGAQWRDMRRRHDDASPTR